MDGDISSLLEEAFYDATLLPVVDPSISTEITNTEQESFRLPDITNYGNGDSGTERSNSLTDGVGNICQVVNTNLFPLIDNVTQLHTQLISTNEEGQSSNSPPLCSTGSNVSECSNGDSTDTFPNFFEELLNSYCDIGENTNSSLNGSESMTSHPETISSSPDVEESPNSKAEIPSGLTSGLRDATSGTPETSPLVKNKENECDKTDVSTGDALTTKVKRKRRRQKNEGPPPEPILPPCSICEEKSSGYHYGANTCEACKGFYRRSVKKKEIDYVCKCTPEDKEAWKRGPHKNGCPSCRYDRCLAVGMSKTAIKIGRYTLNHRTRNIKEVKSIEAVDNLITALTESITASCPSADETLNIPVLDVTDSPLISLPSTTCDWPGTSIPRIPQRTGYIHELSSIVGILTDAHTNLQTDARTNMTTESIRQQQQEYLEKYKLQRELFGTLRRLTNDEFMEFYNATGIEIDDRLKRVGTALNYFEEKIMTLVAFAKAIPDFETLSIDDQANLIKASRVEAAVLCSYKNALRNIGLNDHVFTLPWGGTVLVDEMRKFMPRDLMTTRINIYKQLADLELTTQEEGVLRAILVMFSDRCMLDEPRKVEAIQEKLFSCLQYLLNSRPGGAGTSLYKIFNVFTSLRSLNDSVLNFQKTRFQSLPMSAVKNHPLVKEFVLYG